MARGNSLKSARAIRTGYYAITSHFAGYVGWKRDREWNGSLRQECAIRILIGNPDNLTAVVIKRTNHMRNIDDLAALVDQLSGERRLRNRIEFLTFNPDDRVRR